MPVCQRLPLVRGWAMCYFALPVSKRSQLLSAFGRNVKICILGPKIELVWVTLNFATRPKTSFYEQKARQWASCWNSEHYKLRRVPIRSSVQKLSHVECLNSRFLGDKNWLEMGRPQLPAGRIVAFFENMSTNESEMDLSFEWKISMKSFWLCLNLLFRSRAARSKFLPYLNSQPAESFHFLIRCKWLSLEWIFVSSESFAWRVFEKLQIFRLHLRLLSLCRYSHTTEEISLFAQWDSKNCY